MKIKKGIVVMIGIGVWATPSALWKALKPKKTDISAIREYEANKGA